MPVRRLPRPLPKVKRKAPKILPRQIPPKLIESDYAGHLIKRVIRPARTAYAPFLAAVRSACAEARAEQAAKTDSFDPDQPRDEHGRWAGDGSVIRQTDEKGRGYFGKDIDVVDALKKPGHAYRGMTSEEFNDTVAKGQGVKSKNLYSASTEGTNFSDDPALAESYVNSGRDNPGITGRPTYLVETTQEGLTYNRAADALQTPVGGGVPHKQITRVFEMRPRNGNTEIYQIPVPASSRKDSRKSDVDAGIRALLHKGAKELGKAVSQAGLKDLAEKYARETSTYQKAQLHRQVAKVLGTDPLINDARLSSRIRTFIDHNVSLVTRIPDALHSDLADMVEQGISEAWLTPDLALDIADRFDISERHARLIARDQVGSLYADVNHDRQRSLGVESFIWRTVEDERVRGNPDGLYPKANPSHFDLDGLQFSYDDPPVDDEGVPFLPGDQIQCFPGDVLVRSVSAVKVMYRRRYRGEGTIIKTNDGRVLTSTPNHPVLTRRGWLPAHLVQVGDDIVQASRKSIEMLVADTEHANPTIAEQFGALAPLVGITVRDTESGGFHGDALVNQQIDVVDVNRCLGFELDPGISESFCQNVLARADGPIPAECSFDFLFDGMNTTNRRFMRGCNQFLSALRRELSPTGTQGVATIARLKTIANELSTHGCSRDAELLGDALDAPPIGVEFGQHVARVLFGIVRRAIVQTARLNVPSAERLAEVVSADVQDLGGLGDGMFDEQFSRVVEKLGCELDTHVYNLENASNWYYAQDLVVHNCRCYAEPVLDDILDDLDADDEGGDEEQDPENEDDF